MVVAHVVQSVTGACGPVWFGEKRSIAGHQYKHRHDGRVCDWRCRSGGPGGHRNPPRPLAVELAPVGLDRDNLKDTGQQSPDVVFAEEVPDRAVEIKHVLFDLSAFAMGGIGWGLAGEEQQPTWFQNTVNFGHDGLRYVVSKVVQGQVGVRRVKCICVIGIWSIDTHRLEYQVWHVAEAFLIILNYGGHEVSRRDGVARPCECLGVGAAPAAKLEDAGRGGEQRQVLRRKHRSVFGDRRPRTIVGDPEIALIVIGYGHGSDMAWASRSLAGGISLITAGRETERMMPSRPTRNWP